MWNILVRRREGWSKKRSILSPRNWTMKLPVISTGLVLQLIMTKILNEEQAASRETQLALLHQRILACRLCEQQGYIPAARPLVNGRASDRMMVIGQAPGHRPLAKGGSLSAPAGSTLQKCLE